MKQSSFYFLEELEPELASLAREAENSIWLNPRGTLTQGRLYAELLATTVSIQENVEPVYAIKQIERLHKLAREELISESIRDKFEWLRKNGNTAAHDSREIHADTALTAHRHIFELAIWYVELYGSVAIELPPYQMPTKPSELIIHPVATPPVLDSEMVQKVISDQLEAKLLPTLDEKFRSIEEVLMQLSEKQFVATLENSQPVVISDEEESRYPQQPADKDSSIQSEGKLEIASVLQQGNFKLIDKRAFGGALWVVGGWELKGALGRWNAQGIYFRFARNGSNSTGRKAAWFMLGKPPSAERWIHWLRDEDKKSAVEESIALQGTDLEQSSEELVKMAPELSESIPVPIPDPEIEPEKRPADEISKNESEQQGSVKVPDRLIHQSIRGFASSRLADLSAVYGTDVFGGWTEAKLLELYEQQPRLLHDVMVQLWFFGFQFEDKLGRFLKLQHEPQGEMIGVLQEGRMLDEILSPHVCRMLQRFGILRSDQLSGIPVSSLKWLFKEGHEEMVSLLRHLEQTESLEENPNDAHAQDNENEEKKVFRLNGEELALPVHLNTVLISDLPFQGCAALLRGIQENWYIDTLGDLPEVLSVLPSKIKGVGATAIHKFYNQLKGLANGDLIQDPPGKETSNHPTDTVMQDGTVCDVGVIQWKSEQFIVDEAVMHTGFGELSSKGLSNLISELHQSGIHTVGLLPVRFESLLSLSQVGVTMVDKFYRQLCSSLVEIRQQQFMDEEWLQLSQEQRINQAIQRTSDAWQPWIEGKDKSRGNHRNREVMHYRWLNQRGKRKPTLEEIGQQFGVTRERVRQIIKSQHAQLMSDLIVIERELRAAITAENGFYFFGLDTSSFEHDLMIELLELNGVLHTQGWWTIYSSDEVVALKDHMILSLKQKYKGMLIRAMDIEETLISVRANEYLPLRLMRIWASDILQPVNEEYFMLSNSTKADKVEMLLHMYPTGIEIYKRAEELLETAGQLWPGDFEKKRDIVSVVSRDEYANTAYLWGRGTYIHQVYVKPDVSLIERIAADIEQLLELRSPIAVGHIFSKYQTELNDVQVPNEYALYTLLRKYGTSALQLRKFPHIWHENDGFQLSNAEMIKSYIREHNTSISREQLKQEFVTGRGWKWFTLDFNFSTDSDFVRSGLGMIGLKEFYPLSSSWYEPLSEKLTELLAQAPVVHINRLYEEMLDYCKLNGIESTYTLYDLLQSEEDELPDIQFVRYPLITLADQDSENLSLQMLTEQYIYEQGGIVSRNKVLEWLTEELGARENTLDIVLSNSKDLFYYTRGKNGEYIHRDILDWTEDQEDRLMRWVYQNIQWSTGEFEPYLLPQKLMIDEHLPLLPNHLTWSEDLLIDILKKNKRFILIGSYDAIIVAKEYESIKNELDFIAHIIRHVFQGRVSERDLYRKLAELKYSNDGRFLYETVTAVEAGGAPFELREGVFMIK